MPASLKLDFTFVELDAGFQTFKDSGKALPDKTVDTLSKECDGAMFGAVRSVDASYPVVPARSLTLLRV